MEEIAVFLRRLRQERGLTLGQLANRTKTRLTPKGLSTSYLGHIEKGERHPDCDKLIVLAHAYGLPYEVFLRRAGLLALEDDPTSGRPAIDYELWLRWNCDYCGETLRLNVEQMRAMESTVCPRCQKINAVDTKNLKELHARWERLRPQMETTEEDAVAEAAESPLPEV